MHGQKKAFRPGGRQSSLGKGMDDKSSRLNPLKLSAKNPTKRSGSFPQEIGGVSKKPKHNPK